MSEQAEVVHTFDCGCTADQATGLPIGEPCKAHDSRTSRAKVAAALAQMANALDEAGRMMRPTRTLTEPLQVWAPTAGDHLMEAAKAAVKASKAMIGSSE